LLTALAEANKLPALEDLEQGRVPTKKRTYCFAPNFFQESREVEHLKQDAAE
jgi:hypothetical protein